MPMFYPISWFSLSLFLMSLMVSSNEVMMYFFMKNTMNKNKVLNLHSSKWNW